MRKRPVFKSVESLEILFWLLTLAFCFKAGLCGLRLFWSDPGFGWGVLLGFGHERVRLAGISEPLSRLLPVLLGLWFSQRRVVQRHGGSCSQTRLGLSDFQLNLWRRERKRKTIESHCCFALKQRRTSSRISGSSYRVFHSGSHFTQSLSFLPAHLFQHLPSFIHFTDLPFGKQTVNAQHLNLAFPIR